MTKQQQYLQQFQAKIRASLDGGNTLPQALIAVIQDDPLLIANLPSSVFQNADTLLKMAAPPDIMFGDRTCAWGLDAAVGAALSEHRTMGAAGAGLAALLT